jgi:hypothetical protein
MVTTKSLIKNNESNFVNVVRDVLYKKCKKVISQRSIKNKDSYVVNMTWSTAVDKGARYGLRHRFEA